MVEVAAGGGGKTGLGKYGTVGFPGWITGLGKYGMIGFPGWITGLGKYGIIGFPGAGITGLGRYGIGGIPGGITGLGKYGTIGFPGEVTGFGKSGSIGFPGWEVTVLAWDGPCSVKPPPINFGKGNFDLRGESEPGDGDNRRRRCVKAWPLPATDPTTIRKITNNLW